MTRVLMFCNQFHPLVGGAERQAEKLARALQERDVEVAVLTPRLDPGWAEREDLDGLPVVRYPLPDLAHALPGLRGLGIPNLMLQRRATIRAVSQHLPDYDLLHAHLASSLVAFATEASHRLGRPVLCKVAGGGPSFDFIQLRATSIVAPRIARRLAAQVDRWIAISSEIRGFLRDEGVPEERIVCIPNGVVVPEAVTRRAPERVRRFLFLGRANKCDYPTLFAAFDRLAAGEPECVLRFVVGVEDRGAVEACLAHLPHARAQSELLEHADPGEAMAWTDVLVQPTPAEGMSNVVLEGMASGIPLIASDIPSNREVLDGGRCGLLVPIGDVDALATALEQAVAEPASLLARVANARDRALEHYELGHVAEQYLALYATLGRTEVASRAALTPP